MSLCVGGRADPPKSGAADGLRVTAPAVRRWQAGRSLIGTKIFLNSARAGEIRGENAANISCYDGSVASVAGAPVGWAGR